MTDEVKQQIRQYLLLACVTFLAGGGGASVFGRPDPFTGTDAQKLEARMQRQIDVIVRKDERVEEKLDTALQELAAIRAQLLYLNSGFSPSKVKTDG